MQNLYANRMVKAKAAASGYRSEMECSIVTKLLILIHLISQLQTD